MAIENGDVVMWQRSALADMAAKVTRERRDQVWAAWGSAVGDVVDVKENAMAKTVTVKWRGMENLGQVEINPAFLRLAGYGRTDAPMFVGQYVGGQTRITSGMPAEVVKAMQEARYNLVMFQGCDGRYGAWFECGAPACEGNPLCRHARLFLRIGRISGQWSSMEMGLRLNGFIPTQDGVRWLEGRAMVKAYVIDGYCHSCGVQTTAGQTWCQDHQQLHGKGWGACTDREGRFEAALAVMDAQAEGCVPAAECGERAKPLTIGSARCVGGSGVRKSPKGKIKVSQVRMAEASVEEAPKKVKPVKVKREEAPHAKAPAFKASAVGTVPADFEFLDGDPGCRFPGALAQTGVARVRFPRWALPQSSGEGARRSWRLATTW